MLLTLYRHKSDDTRLWNIELSPAVCEPCMRLPDSSVTSFHATLDSDAQLLVVSASGVPGAGASVAIDGKPSPRTYDIRLQRTVVMVTVTAQVCARMASPEGQD